MFNTLDINTINSFLKTCKKEIKKGNCYFVGYRKVNVNGHTTGTVASYGYYKGNIKGTATFTLNNVNRYIEKNSRWLIGFIGGDMSMPAVICRLPDDIDHVEYEYVPIG